MSIYLNLRGFPEAAKLLGVLKTPPPCIIGLMTLDSLDSLDGPKTARTGRSTFFQAKIVHPILIFLNILSSKAKQNCLNSKNP